MPHARHMRTCDLAMCLQVSDLEFTSLSVELRKDVDYAHCSTPHVAALALQTLKTPLACTLVFGYVRLL